MRQAVAHVQHRDEFGRPAGGEAAGVGLSVRWQNGPLVAPDGRRLEPNGCFVETLLQVAAERLEHYQGGLFACAENAEALAHVEAALAALDRRTARRVAAGIEGTHGTELTETGEAKP